MKHILRLEIDTNLELEQIVQTLADGLAHNVEEGHVRLLDGTKGGYDLTIRDDMGIELSSEHAGWYDHPDPPETTINDYQEEFDKLFDKPIKVKEIKKTCCACPAQWAGTSTEGDDVYIRHRHGYCRCDINDHTVFGTNYSEGCADGAMDARTMKRLLRNILDFSEMVGNEMVD